MDHIACGAFDISSEITDGIVCSRQISFKMIKYDPKTVRKLNFYEYQRVLDKCKLLAIVGVVFVDKKDLVIVNGEFVCDLKEITRF